MNLNFNNNQPSSASRNLFTSSNQPSVNLFTGNRPQIQNQNIQIQPVVLPNQPNPPPNESIPQNPRVQDSLQQKNSFIKIYSKIANRQKLTNDQINFVTKKGLVMFEKDKWKQNYFKTVKSQESHLGFGPEVLIYNGQIPKCKEIDEIWIKIIKHFAYICDTHEMNGYFLIKQILIQGRYYQKLYKPKPGLGNKVFEPNQQTINQFYNIGFSAKPIVNKNGKIYLEILQKLVNVYINEWSAYFEIVQKVGIGFEDENLDENTALGQKLGLKSNLSVQSQPGVQLRRLKFEDLQKENIIGQLWKTYQKFAFSASLQPEKFYEKEDIVKQRFITMKKNLFFKISNLITRLLQVKYTQEKLMENQPIPIVGVIEFVTQDIEKVQINNLIEPQKQNMYIDNGLSLILAAIPFASFILNDVLLFQYFNSPSQKNKFNNARTLQPRQQILKELVKVKLIQFQPLAIWANLELKRITISGPVDPNRSPSEKETQRRRQAVQTWENYFAKENSNFDIFEEDKWKYWIGLFIENTSMQAIIQSTALRNHVIYYCKRTLKGRSSEFFRLWDDLSVFESSDQYKDLEREFKYLPTHPSQQQRKQSIYTFPPRILRHFDLYITGRFLKTINDDFNYIADALSVFTTLLKHKKQDQNNYTQKLLFFLSSFSQPNQPILTSNLFDTVIGSLSAGFQICCKKKDFQNQIHDYTKMKDVGFMVDGQSMEYEVKFFCQLVIQNSNTLEFLESYIFDSRDHIQVTGDQEGIRTCIFLCKILEKISSYTIGNIKCMRYLIRAIDWLFTKAETRQLVLCALSIVFPYGLVKNKPLSITRTTQLSERSSRRCIRNIMQFLELQQSSTGEQLKQVKKLRKTFSYHFSHMIKSCDSVDEYFTIDKEYDQLERYSAIEQQVNKWKFTAVSSYLRHPQRRFRAADWFYTIARVMQSSQLLPIDIDSIIECLRKMRIPNDGNYISFEPMSILFRIINRESVLEQLLKFIKPIGCQHKLTTMIQNQKMACYKPSKIQLEQPSGTKYSKYQNKTVVECKNVKLIIQEQVQLLKTICLHTRLIEQILRLKLAGFDNYSMIKNLYIVEGVINKLTIKQDLHHFRAVSNDQGEQSSIKMNLIASVVALLNLYKYKCKFPNSMPQVKQNVMPLLKMIENSTKNNLAFEDKYQRHKFTFYPSEQNVHFYDSYKDDLRFVSQKYFESVMYEMTDFSFENDQTSLRGTVFNILQLLFENNCSKLVVQSLSNYSYPLTCSGNIENYSLTGKYLLSENYRNLIPMIFFHINSLLAGQSVNAHFELIQNLPHISRTLEAMSFFMSEPLLAKQIISYLPNLRKQFIKFITTEQLYKHICPRSQQINILNRISLFILRLLQTTKLALPEEEFHDKIINNFLINPENILKMLFERMTQILPEFRIDKFILIETESDHLANYIMQINLTRNTIYRATYNILIRILLFVLQFIRKDQMAQILSHLMFKNAQIITRKPKQLNFQPQILMNLQLIPSETIQICHKLDINTPTTILSQNVTQFTYCNRNNFRKYGPNFLYDSHLAFHMIKAQSQQLISSPEQTRNKIRRQVFLIQLVNCLKSLYFAYQSMVKSYFQIMYLITNTGSMGQNISTIQLDKYIPKTYENIILQNKYCLQNNFSFNQSIDSLKNMNKIPSEQSIIIRIIKVMEEFLAFVQIQPESFEVFFTEKVETDAGDVRGIPRNVIFHDRVYLKTKIGDCLNPGHVVKVIRNIMNALIEHLSLNQGSKQGINRYTQFLQYLVNILGKFRCPLRVILHCFSSIITQYSKIIEISNMSINQAPSVQAIYHRNQNIEAYTKLQQNWLDSKKNDYLIIKQKIISTCSDILYRFYENQKPTNYFHQQFRNSIKMIREHDFFQFIDKDELQRNIGLICSISSQIYTESPYGNNIGHILLSSDPALQLQTSINRSVGYILKLFVQNVQDIKNSISRVSIFSLCNKFYFVNSDRPVTIWPFHANHFAICKEILLESPRIDQDSSLILERITAFDSFCTFALANQNVCLNAEFLPILIDIINFDNDFVRKYRIQNSLIHQSDRALSKKEENRIQMQKRYNFRSPVNQFTSLHTVVEYKKLLMTLLVAFAPGNWAESSLTPEINAIYIEILKFGAFDFTTSKLYPQKAGEKRLQNMIVTDDSPKKASLSKTKQNTIQNHLIPTQTLSTSSTTKYSLFDFICFIHHNELIYTYLLLLKTGLHTSKILNQFQGYFLQPSQYTEIWESIQQKVHSLYEYYTSLTENLLENPRMVSSLTYLYNYVCKDPSYMLEFNGLTMFFDQIDQNYARNQLVTSIIEYCTTVNELIPKMREIQWKGTGNKKEQRIACLTRCIRLLQKTKIINAFKELRLHDDVYESVKNNLIDQIKNERTQQKKKSKSSKWSRY